MKSRVLSCLLLTGLATGSALAALPAEFEKHVAVIRAVGPEGSGNAEAAAAYQSISASDAEAILPLLRAMESSGQLSRNWLRSAVEVVVERSLKAKKPLPLDDLKTFLLDTQQAPEARRLAFDLMAKIDAPAAEKLVPGFLNDPSTELRRDAVAQLMIQGKSEAEKDDKTAAVATYRRALDAARDVDQIQEIAKQLSEKLGQELDLPRHFGFLNHWQVIGPFENTGREGFETVFAPEKEIKLDAKYPGKGEKEVAWQPFASADEYGKVDLNIPFGPLKEVTGYAYTEYTAAEARPAELRLACKNAWKIWFNGELVFGRDEYHRGQRIDQYKMPIQLKEGKNTLLVKLCQNEQTQDWTVEWEFKLRVCDATGTAILATDRPATPKKEAPKRRGGGEEVDSKK
jgi:hypothetical protein